MAGKIREYSTDEITVTYDARRCIHASECVHGLRKVFDPERRPWVDPAGARPDEIVGVILRCPTGALQFRRRDGGPPESAPSRNTAVVSVDGPIYLTGQVEILRDQGPTTEHRVALCRCGASKHKPYCDGQHLDAAFTHDGSVDTSRAVDEPLDEPHGTLEITPRPGGPLIVTGAVEIVSADGESRGAYRKTALCRCGHSQNKPFCDGAHKNVEGWE